MMMARCEPSYRFDMRLRQHNTRLTAEQREQYRDTITAGHPGVQAELALERAGGDADAGSQARPARPGQNDEAVTLARSDLVDHPVGNMRRLCAVHD
jgi:hypothetical protein